MAEPAPASAPPAVPKPEGHSLTNKAIQDAFDLPYYQARGWESITRVSPLVRVIRKCAHEALVETQIMELRPQFDHFSDLVDKDIEATYEVFLRKIKAHPMDSQFSTLITDILLSSENLGKKGTRDHLWLFKWVIYGIEQAQQQKKRREQRKARGDDSLEPEVEKRERKGLSILDLVNTNDDQGHVER
ncbi:hypothetical protein TWF696_001847 [Orbilia brochopaga]|uniref:Uncharacterized protein n=1 Tax=Orbilia brochopaga TaxID=3140254 RepID=A0AAV9U691_9PEZI